ncbi:MAG: alpha/beta fold hydrolase [Pseudomonadota bacterium]
MNNLITDARHIPVNDAVQTIAINPVTLSVPRRGVPLEMRITLPLVGHDLPIILLSHGHGPSLYIPSKDGYGPLANFYAEHGFAVIQPTHVNSKVGGLPTDAPGGPLFWRSRVEDVSLILDRLDEIEAAVPAIAGRLDHDKVAAVGHSLGGQTAGMLLGARLTDHKDPDAVDVDLRDVRIKAGVLLAAPGKGGADLSDFARENYSALNPDFSHMTTRTLVVAGDSDMAAHLTTRGPDWYRDPFRESPGAEAMLTLVGGRHGLGGVSGYDAKETSDEDPDRLAIVQRMTWAFLRSALHEGIEAWSEACTALQGQASSHGVLELK